MEPIPIKKYQANHVLPAYVLCECGKLVNSCLLATHQASLSHIRAMNRQAKILVKVVVCTCNRLISKGQMEKHLKGTTHAKLLHLLRSGMPTCACGLAYNGPHSSHALSENHLSNMTALDQKDFDHFVISNYGSLQNARQNVISLARTELQNQHQEFQNHVNVLLAAKRLERNGEVRDAEGIDLTGSIEPCHICLMRPIEPVVCANRGCHGLFCRQCAAGLVIRGMACPRRCRPGPFAFRPALEADVSAVIGEAPVAIDLEMEA